MGKQTKKMITFIAVALVLLLIISAPVIAREKEPRIVGYHVTKQTEVKTLTIPEIAPRFKYDAGVHFKYPDAVRGVYLTGNIAGGYKNYLDHKQTGKKLYTTGRKFGEVINLMEQTDLNAVVVDIKEDKGYITYQPSKDSPFAKYGQPYIDDPRALIAYLEKKQIYPIARIVVFKDTIWAKERPDVSFVEKNGQVWTNGNGDAFVNPFMKEVWDRNVQIAIEAAKMGFQEIQFDYVRFPEGFEKRDDILKYNSGDYKGQTDDVQKRVQAVTDFVAYAKQQLKYYGVDVSVDIFGYSATLPEAPGIGQNFTKISQNVDVISSMIYPSHWGFNYFNVPEPDKDPYRLVKEYAKVENKKLDELKAPPVSRPWIQDFEAPWLYTSRGLPVMQYGKKEVEAQIRALNEEGITEFLLWNASNNYTKNVDYTPLN